MMVLPFGAFILVFRCCEACDLEARETAEVGYKLGVIDAHERLAEMPLPAWARTAPATDKPASWWARVWAWLWWRLGPPPTPPGSGPTGLSYPA